MKFVTAILACIVLLTSAYPVSQKYLLVSSTKDIQQNQCCMKKHTQCSKAEKHTNSNSKDDCGNNNCSPFSVCNYYPVTQPFSYCVTDPAFFVINAKFLLFYEHIFSSYHSDIWHPPRLV